MSRYVKVGDLKPGEAFLFSSNTYIVLRENAFYKRAMAHSTEDTMLVLRLTTGGLGPNFSLATFGNDDEVEIYEPHP